MSNNLAVVILAAGEGTRMKSETPKSLHLLCSKPLISWVLSSVKKLNPTKVVVVVGNKAEEVKKALEKEKVFFVEQKHQLGSGDALKSARKELGSFNGNILVLCADTPLVSVETLKGLFRHHLISQNMSTILSAQVKNPFSYGRIIRSKNGDVRMIT